jgi:hemolysin activation/secretion protein
VRQVTGRAAVQIRHTLRALAAASFAVALLVGPCAPAHGQRLDPTLRSGDRPLIEREQLPQQPPPGRVLPPIPPVAPRQFELLPRIRVRVREIRVVGSTVFTPEQLERVTAPYVGREVSAEDLEALRVALTMLYVERGYINSGAILPDQTVSDGVVTFQIVEGALSGVVVEGNRWFNTWYLRKRFALGAGHPLNINGLQERLQLLLEDQRIRRLNAELRPGLDRGESVLHVKVEERLPFRIVLDVDNYQPPDVGAERGIVTLEHQNVTGSGDVLTLRFGKSEGLEPLLDFRYALPVTAYDTTLAFQYRRNTFSVVAALFQDLDITSESEIFTFSVRQPVYRTLASEVAVELIGERLSARTELLGEPFSLSPGAQNGESVVTALRAVVEGVHRTQDQVIAVRSRFSVGIDALGATIHPPGQGPDGRFFSWLGQVQYVRRLPWQDIQVIARTDLQLADDSLLSLEQIAIGGRYSVRGYRENTLLRDNALLASLETRVPLIRNRRWAEYLELAPFVDFGKGWNTTLPTPDIQSLSSVGIGLRWAATIIPGPIPVRSQFEVYWGHQLRKIETQGNALQDNGIHAQISLAIF